MSTQVREEIKAFTKKLLDERLAQLYPAQLALFHRLFPGGPREDQMVTAISLCDRTIRKNAADPTRAPRHSAQLEVQ